MVKISEPWASMTEEQAETLNESQIRDMIGTVSTPLLDEFRLIVPKMRTSEVVMYIANPKMYMAKLIPGDDLEQYDDEDAGLITAAAALVLGDQLDKRVPIP
jgi:hypothetical protein